VDQGTADEFLEKQLLSNHLMEVCKAHGQKLNLRFQQDYDHSYYFISTFIRDHIAFHADLLV
jgi:S-formylglutathione hydrolase